MQGPTTPGASMTYAEARGFVKPMTGIEPTYSAWESACPSSASWSVIDRFEGPVMGQPIPDGRIENGVEIGVIRAYPRADRGGARVAVLRRVDVDAAEHLLSVRTVGRQDGVGEASAGGKVGGVLLQVGQVLRGRHHVRPGPPSEARGSPDVLHAPGPRSMVGGIVLRPEWSQPKTGPDKLPGYDEVGRHERPFSHDRERNRMGSVPDSRLVARQCHNQRLRWSR
jgi:hypothetical protein